MYSFKRLHYFGNWLNFEKSARNFFGNSKITPLLKYLVFFVVCGLLDHRIYLKCLNLSFLMLAVLTNE